MPQNPTSPNAPVAGAPPGDADASPATPSTPAPRTDDVITGEVAAAEVFNQPRSTFAERRRRLELEFDREAGVLRELPVIASREEEDAWRAAACLVVVEWGGFKAPNGPWTFLRSWCVAYRDEGLVAVLRAHRHVREALGLASMPVGRRRPRSTRNGKAPRATKAAARTRR